MKKIFVAFSMLFSHFLIADGLIFGEPSIAGPGCPPGSISWALSPSNNSLSILLSQFSLTAGISTGAQRTYCVVTTSVSIKNETVIQADYRGFHDLPDPSTFDHQVTYSLDTERVIASTNSLYGPTTDVHVHSHQVNMTCNGTHILKLFINSLLLSTTPTQNGSITLDSVDLGQAMTPNVTLSLCNSAAQAGTIVSSLLMAAVLLFGL